MIDVMDDDNVDEGAGMVQIVPHKTLRRRSRAGDRYRGRPEFD